MDFKRFLAFEGKHRPEKYAVLSVISKDLTIFARLYRNVQFDRYSDN